MEVCLGRRMAARRHLLAVRRVLGYRLPEGLDLSSVLRSEISVDGMTTDVLVIRSIFYSMDGDSEISGFICTLRTIDSLKMRAL